MSFFMMPYQTPRVSSTPFEYPFFQNENNRPVQYQHVVQTPHVSASSIETIPFKVYVFDRKFNHNMQLGSALNILRFEIESHERSIDLFNRVLRDHSIDMQSNNFYYFDDENDLVSLSGDGDFQFMTKLMKGKMIKVVCEKKNTSQQSKGVGSCVIPGLLYGQCPLFGFERNKPEPSSVENLLEKAFSSSFSFETPQAQSFFPSDRVVASQKHPIRKESPRTRTIEINLSNYLGISPLKDQINPENKETTKRDDVQQEKNESPKQSFRDFLVQRLKQRYPVEPKQETPQQFELKNEETKDETQNKEHISEQTESKEAPHEETKSSPVENPTSPLLFSNNTELEIPNIELETQPTQVIEQQFKISKIRILSLKVLTNLNLSKQAFHTSIRKN